jgi:hypothetical protein
MAMSTRDEWIISRAASTLGELNGLTDKCHLDEAIVLCNYLNGEMNSESAARAITALISPKFKSLALVRLMRLLADTLLHYEQDCDMILDLLVAIQNLPPTPVIHWWKLPSFARYWQRSYERLIDGRTITIYKKLGTLEAKMYLRGIYSVDDEWAYRAINLICLEQPDLEVVIYEIYAWLDIAGPKLAENLQSAQIKSYTRAMRGRRDKTYMIEVTMYEHWEHWKKRFLQVSHDEELLSPEARQMAGKCHEIMKSHVISQPCSRAEL